MIAKPNKAFKNIVILPSLKATNDYNVIIMVPSDKNF